MQATGATYTVGVAYIGRIHSMVVRAVVGVSAGAPRTVSGCGKILGVGVGGVGGVGGGGVGRVGGV